MRGRRDCGTAALATLLAPRVNYDLVAAHAPRGGQAGYLVSELCDTARQLGVHLQPTRSFNLERHTGVLRVRSPKLHREGHWVTVRRGLIWDPWEGVAEPWQAYAARHRAR